MLYADKRCMSKIPVSLCMLGNLILHELLSDFFFKINFFWEYQQSVKSVLIQIRPDMLGPICCKKLSADDATDRYRVEHCSSKVFTKSFV